MTPNAELQRIEVLDLGRIRTDGETQGRVHLNDTVVDKYAQLMNAGVEFPPVRIWFDGEFFWLSDGFQRVAAAIRIGRKLMNAEIWPGTLEEARWDSYSANGSHGLRRTETDIYAIVKKALAHPNAAQLSNNQIARHLNLPEATFRRWRKLLSSSRGEDTVRIALRGSTVYRMDTTRIGQRNRERRPKSCKKLEQDLDEMRSSASPHTERLLNVLGNWIRNSSSASVTLAAIEGFLLDRDRTDGKSSGLAVGRSMHHNQGVKTA